MFTLKIKVSRKFQHVQRRGAFCIPGDTAGRVFLLANENI